MQLDRPASSSGGLPEVARTVGTVSGRPRVPAFGTPALSASRAGQVAQPPGGGELIWRAICLKIRVHQTTPFRTV